MAPLAIGYGGTSGAARLALTAVRRTKLGDGDDRRLRDQRLDGEHRAPTAARRRDAGTASAAARD